MTSQVLEGLIDAAGYGRETPVAVGVSSGGEVVLAGEGDAVFYAGSLAKQVTGACAALLVGEGALDVEAPIADRLPELPGWARSVRVRHLVHHTAGLPSTEHIWERMEGAGELDWSSDGVLAALSEMELAAPPGKVYAYSNAGYICLARILELIAGQGLGALAEARLFRPLELRATALTTEPPQSMPSPAPLSLGDGGLWTSVRDLLRWNQALLLDTLGLAGTIHATGALDDGTPLEYGWGVRIFQVGEQQVQSHGGSWDDATSKLVRLPGLGASFAALAADGSVERMTALSSLIQDELLSGGDS